MASILPVTSSDLEKKLESLGDRYDFDTPIRDLWNADKCPESLLIYLAWALSVDNWDDNWPVEIKRQVVKNSLDIHRLKGTSKGLSDALGAMNRGVTIEYWHQNPDIEKGKFRAVIKSDDEEITDKTYREVVAVINENKRGTLHLDSFNISTLSKSNLKCFSYVKIGENIKVHSRAVEDVKTSVGLFTGIVTIIRERIKVRVRSDMKTYASLFNGAVTIIRERIKISTR